MATVTLPPDFQPSPADIHAAVVKAGGVTILDLLDYLPWLQNAADWLPWRAFLCAVYGLPMSQREYDIFARCTGRKTAPTKQAREVWVVVGRRGRKSAIAALMGVFHGAYRDHEKYLAPGEKAAIPILARNKAEARQIRDYAVAILGSPALSHLIEGEPTAEEIRLRTRVDLRIKAASLTAGRSKTSPLGLFDEVAFFRDESAAAPDEEIINGFRPAMSTVPDALLAAFSSPYSRRGILWKNYQEHYRVDGDPVLVWQADTLAMHDTEQLRAFVSEQYNDDPARASAEYGAEFRKDLEAFVPIETVKSCVDVNVSERAPIPGVTYHAFVDPSGGTADPMALGIAHWDARLGCSVQDYVSQWEVPLDPDSVTVEMIDVLRKYGVRRVTGDHYAGEWPRAAFRKGGHAKHCRMRQDEDDACDCDSVWKVAYEVSEDTKSNIYRDFLPLLNSGTTRLLDVPRMHNQLTGLDRRTARGGHESIDHAPGAHDDLANVTAGVLRLAHAVKSRPKPYEKEPETVEEVERVKRQKWLRSVIAGAERKRRDESGVPGL